MLNSPVLDTTIGLVFIFLLYSLLATSIQEAFATLMGLRATMLKKSIVKHMLDNAPKQSTFEKIIAFFVRLTTKEKNTSEEGQTDIAKIASDILPKASAEEKTNKTSLGLKFYNHPMIKNYGENNLFSLPSYIPKDNFSSVLIDIMLKDFTAKAEDIAMHKITRENLSADKETIMASLMSLSNAYKIKELLLYHLELYKKEGYYSFLPCETCQILEMHLRNSLYDLDAFSKRLEGWFDDTMQRVSGWYKRKTQFVLFFIGIVMAVSFNVDIIAIAGKLSTDKNARDQIVKLAVKAADTYKDDPRVKQISAKREPSADEQLELEDIKKEYDAHMVEAKKMMETDVAQANNMLSAGWDGYGINDEDFLKKIKSTNSSWNYSKIWDKVSNGDTLKIALQNDLLKHKRSIDSLKQLIVGETKNPGKKDNTNLLTRLRATVKKETLEAAIHKDSISNALFYKQLNSDHGHQIKLRYMVYAIGFKKLLGFIILAFGISLGAAFWFDLLNKLVKIRGTGKKEDTEPAKASAAKQEQKPVIITVNNQQNGEEAVG